MISEHASPLSVLGGVDSGGQNVYVAHVAQELARRGFLVDVATRRDSPSLPPVVEYKSGVRVLHINAGPSQFVRKEELLQYMGEFTESCLQLPDEYDIIHANFWMSGLVGVELKNILGVPLAVTFHALGRVRRLHQATDDGFPDSRFEIEEEIMRHADCILAECPQDKEDMISLYGADKRKIEIVPCGVDLQHFFPLERDEARRVVGVGPEERVVLQLGRMVRRKGVEDVVRAIALYNKSSKLHARLLVVGGESDEPDPLKCPEIGRLMEIARGLGVEDSVTFVGRRGRSELRYYYSAADIFVSTPWYEPFGITPLEAMACGTPVIGSAVGGIKFTVLDGKSGCLVPPKDPAAIAEKMSLMFGDPMRLQQMGRKALEVVRGRFTWRHVATRIGNVFNTLLERDIPRVERHVEVGRVSYPFLYRR